MASGRLSKVKGKVLDIPNAPTIGTATDSAAGGRVSVAFTADSSGKGGPTYSYIAKSNPNSITATGSTSPISVTGLTNDTAYTFTVAGVNPTGIGQYSAASNSATPTVPPTAYESIATVTVGSGGQTAIEFTSIPSTFKHLQVRAIVRDNRVPPSGNYNNMHLQVGNGSIDTGSNYTYHTLRGNRSTASADGAGSQVKTDYTVIPSSTAGANTFGAQIWDFLDYANTNKYKTIRVLSGADDNGSTGFIEFTSTVWQSNNAITNLKFSLSSTPSFVQYTQYALYGVKG
jgi:hypothetical protein